MAQNVVRRMLVVGLLFISASLFAQAVSPSGSLTYEYPIKTPPGAGGMSPEISLYYDSAMDNGILGMGWSVKGLSVISRDPSYPINFDDGADHFVYNGQKLIKSTDGFYHTKYESFLRIQFFNPNTAISFWTITDKQGKISYFGNTTDSHIDGIAYSGRARVWALNKVQDTLGNYFAVVYYNDTSTGAYYPNQILYTKNDSHQPSSFNAIDFSYELRADSAPMYIPSLVNATQRLKYVTILNDVGAGGAGENLIRKYRLNYQYSGLSGRSQMTALKEYGNDGNWPPPGLVTSYTATGSGLPEARLSWGSNPQSSFNSDVLTIITSPSGGTISATYAPAPQVPGAVVPSSSSYPIVANSSPRPLVTKLIYDDGLGGTSSTSYSYADGRYLSGTPENRQDLGFASTTATVDSTQAYVKTYYRQDLPYAGLIDKVDTFGSDGKLYKETRNYYSSTTSAPSNPSDQNITFVYKTAQEESNFNGESTADVYREEYFYDAYGNVRLTDNKGNVHLDDTQTEITYAVNTSAWIFAPSTKTTSAYGLNDNWGVAAKEQYFYDSLASGQISTGLLTSEIQGLGSATVTRTYGYDAYGNLIWTRDGRANAGEYATHTTEVTIDPTYHTYVIAKTNARGQTTTTGYDILMRPISTTDANNQTLAVQYDVYSRQTATIAPLDSTSSPTTRTYYLDGQLPGGLHTQQNAGLSTIDSYAYTDGFGRTVQIKQQDVNGGWVTTDTYYDGTGRAYKTSVPYETTTYAYTTRDATTQKYTELQFDPIGRAWQRTNTDGTYAQTLYGKKSITTIDENGHVTALNTVDRRTTTTSRYTDVYPTQQVYSTTTTKKAFDGERVTDQKGNVMQTTLDALGQKIAYSDPDMGSWSYSHDADGNVVSQTDAKGQTRTFQYDFLNRILKKIYPDATSVDYGYDETSHGVAPIGHPTTVSFPNGADYYNYDARGRVSSSTRTLSGTSRTIAYTYDSLDRVTTETYPDGEVVSHSYDARGNLTGLAGAGSYSYISGIQYAANNKISQMTFGNGARTQYDYYDDITKPDQSSGKTFSYRLRGISITNGLTTIANTTYQYDKKDNLMLKDFRDGSQYYTEQYSYDEFDRLATAQSPDLYGSKAYQYDVLDNITSKDGRSYSYGATQPHAVLSDGTYTYTYDANGNMVTRSDGRTITYDYENRVTSILNTGTYSYDADDQRTTKSEEGATTYYFFPDYEETQQSEQPTSVVKYYFACGMRMAERSSVDGLLFYHTDHLGSAVRVTDANGTIVKSIAYDPFGADVYNSGTPTITHKYTDQTQDIASGLYYYGARYYDPVLGRFISPDTMLSGLNRYAYCGDNPVKHTDPTGHFFLIDDIIIAVCVIVGAYIGGSIANDNWNPAHWDWNNPGTYFGIVFGAGLGLVGGEAALSVAGVAGASTLSGSLGVAGLTIFTVSNDPARQSNSESSNNAAINGLDISMQNASLSYQTQANSMDYLAEMEACFFQQEQGAGDPANLEAAAPKVGQNFQGDGEFSQLYMQSLYEPMRDKDPTWCLATAVLNSWAYHYGAVGGLSDIDATNSLAESARFNPATGWTSPYDLYGQLSTVTGHAAPSETVLRRVTAGQLYASDGALIHWGGEKDGHWDFITNRGVIVNSYPGWRNSLGRVPDRWILLHWRQ